MNGPFFSERPICLSFRLSAFGFRLSAFGSRAPHEAPSPYFCLRWTMNLSVDLRLRVLYPLVGKPHGDTGCRPPDVLPSPPPSGWSTGFIATPRTWGRFPSQRLRPAFPIDTFS